MNNQPSGSGGSAKPNRKRDAQRNSPPEDFKAEDLRKANNSGEPRRSRSVSTQPSDEQFVKSGRSQSAVDLSGDSRGFIRSRPKKANIQMMKEVSFDMTREAFQAQLLNDMKRSEHPFLLKFRPGENGKAVKVAGPDYSWKYRKYLPKDLNDKIPNEMIVAEEDHGDGLRNILSLEQCQRLDDYISTQIAGYFGECSISETKQNRPFVDNPVQQVRAMNDPAQTVIEEQIRKKLERERHFRERSRIIPEYGFLKPSHNPTLNFFDVHVINNDCDAFIKDLENVAWKKQNKNQREDPFNDREIRNPLHTAAELGRLQFIDQLFRYLQTETASKEAKILVSSWMNGSSGGGGKNMLPFQTALLTDFSERFELASLLLRTVEGSTMTDLVYKPRSALHVYKESVLDLVILTGNRKFIEYFINKMPQMTVELKKIAILSIVCTGDAQLLLHVWNMAPNIDPVCFISSTAGSISGFCAGSPFLTAIDRNDLYMVQTILHIWPPAANILDILYGVLPYQYAMLTGADQKMVELLRSSCGIPFDNNFGAVQVLVVMKAALRAKCRPLYNEALDIVMKFQQSPDFNLPGLLRYATVSRFYDVAENILNMCISHENLRRNMHEELKQFYAFLLSCKNIDDDMFHKFRSLLNKCGITMEIVIEFVKEESRKQKNEMAKNGSARSPFPSRRLYNSKPKSGK